MSPGSSSTSALARSGVQSFLTPSAREHNGEESPLPEPQSARFYAQWALMGVRILGERTGNPRNCLKLCGNPSGCVSKAPKAGNRPAGSSSRVSLWLFLISALLSALFSQALHLEGTQAHRRPSLTTPATSGQESSRKTVVGPEWVVRLTLWPGYGSPVFTSWGPWGRGGKASSA